MLPKVIDMAFVIDYQLPKLILLIFIPNYILKDHLVNSVTIENPVINHSY